MRPACVSSPKSAKICELPKVFLAKRRNICVSPTLAVLDAAVGHIGPIGHIGRRLTPLCTAPFHRPAGALLHLLNLLNLLTRVVGASAPLPQSMACEARHAPTGPPGRTCAFAHARRPAPLRSQILCVLRVLCDSQNTLAVLVEVWKLRGLEAWLSQRPCPSRACRAFSVLRGRGRFGPLGLHALFSVLRGAPAPLGPSCPS